VAFAQAVTFEPGIAAREGGHIYEGVSGTIRANAGDNMMAVCYDGRGNGNGEIVPTITGDHNNRITDYTAICCEPASYLWDGGQIAPTLTANNAGGNQRMPGKDNFNCVIQQVTGVDCRNMNEYPELYPTLQAKPNGGQSLNFPGSVRQQYIVRRLTPTECARLQGFPDWWGHISEKADMTDEEYSFWLEVRNTHARINGKPEKEYTKPQMLTWYNKLHTDGAEYKMWGNGIALPPALYCMQGIMEVLTSGKTTSDPLPVRCDDAEIGEQMRLF
jgi:hypothetical protein